MKRALVLAIGFVLAVSIAASAQSTPTPQAPKTGAAFVDANGDGICDNYQGGTPGGGKGSNQGRGKRLGARDGSGFGAGSGVASGTGTGTCDGTGPKGRQAGRGRR
jgi:hypothetical protein